MGSIEDVAHRGAAVRVKAMDHQQKRRVLIIIVVMFTIFFSLRALSSYRALMEMVVYGEAHVTSLRGWMTIPYSAVLVDADPVCVCNALEVPLDRCEKVPVHRLVRDGIIHVDEGGGPGRRRDPRKVSQVLEGAFIGCKAARTVIPSLEEDEEVGYIDEMMGNLLTSTYPVLAMSVMLGSAGIPAPTSLLVIGAGAFSAQGFANILVVIIIAALFASFGDCLGYLIGATVGGSPERLPGPLAKSIEVGRSTFSEVPPNLIFTSRFLFTPLIIPVNLVAGVYKIGLQRFYPIALSGEVIWAMEMAGLGYVFGSNVELIYDVVGNLSIVAVLLLGAWALYHHRDSAMPSEIAI